MKKLGAVAVDLGASSGRFAAGWVEEGQIVFEVIEQIPHGPVTQGNHDVWDLDKLLGLCKRAMDYAEANFETSAVGIDAWGVDHGFLDGKGALLQTPICYRDPSHSAAFERLAEHRSHLFALTGIAAQPFNTIYQLAARKAEGCPAHRWLPLPDLLGYLLGGSPHVELTQASTSGLLGLDGQWSEEAFRLIDWPIPEWSPTAPRLDALTEKIRPNVYLSHVGSHDTASAVQGLGDLAPGTMYLNVGTWALAGVVLDSPLATPGAEAAGFTNERAVDGRVRFLKNVPGFYVVNRLHEDLGIAESVPQWLSHAVDTSVAVDLLAPELYNPESMVAAVTDLGGFGDLSPAQWAGLALTSMAQTISAQVSPLESLIGQSIRTIRVSGGGSQSEALCQKLASVSGREVVAGPAEATVLGNLAVSLKALGSEEFTLSGKNRTYQPGARIS
jgi:rhamnulokinase